MIQQELLIAKFGDLKVIFDPTGFNNQVVIPEMVAAVAQQQLKISKEIFAV